MCAMRKTMWAWCLTLGACVLALCAGAYGAEKDLGLVLHYDLNEGTGAVAKDRSGNKNDGKMVGGAKWVKGAYGSALELNGTDAYLNCGAAETLNIASGGTLSVWCYPYAAQGGIVYWGTGANWPDERLMLAIYNGVIGCFADGKQHQIVRGFGDLKPREWVHLAITFDGKTVSMYRDGLRRGDPVPQLAPPVIKGVPLWIGRSIGLGQDYFRGAIDEVRIYNRPLSAQEIFATYKAEAAARNKDTSWFAKFEQGQITHYVEQFVPVKPVITLPGEEMAVKVGASGEIQIDAGTDSYLVESCFSYPGPKAGWNGLPRKFDQEGYPGVGSQADAEPAWAPSVKRVSADTVSVEAEGKCYRLQRTVRVQDAKVVFEDTFTNLREVPTGIIVRHGITAPSDFRERFSLSLEVACNPMVYLTGPHSSLGVVMQDDVSRLRFRPEMGSSLNHSGVQINRFALDKGKSYTFSWAIYVVKEGRGYFDFVNRVRRDWNANFTVQGAFRFGYLFPEGDDIKFYFTSGNKTFYLNQVLKAPGEFKDYLEWQGGKIIAVAPWLDYDPGAMDHVVSRGEYKEMMQGFLSVVKQVAPNIRVIGCIETPFATIHPDQIKDGDKLPGIKVGDPTGLAELTPEQVKIIDQANLPWKDSFICDADGKLLLESYSRGGKIVAPAIMVYPAVGNYHYEFMMGQVKFLIEEVGMDGVYFDMFSVGRRDYRRWDGLSADIDFMTGEIGAKHTDCSLASIQARVNLINYLTSRGKIVIANFYSTSKEEQSLPVNRFAETGGFDPLSWADGTEPPAVNYMFYGHLNSPIGLGVRSGPGDPARSIMKALVTYLRHGMLFYYGDSGPAEPPMTSENRDVFGVVKHMFPITPIELGEGFIIGKERILTAISLNQLWKKEGKPEVMFFDMAGRKTDAADRYEVKPENGQWRVILKLKDWSEIAVVE